MTGPLHLHAARLASEPAPEPGWFYPGEISISHSTATNSMRLGRGTYYDAASGKRQSVRVFQAHASIPCAVPGCGRIIAPGELFSRQTLPQTGDRHRVHPICRRCFNFEPPAHGGEVR